MPGGLSTLKKDQLAAGHPAWRRCSSLEYSRVCSVVGPWETGAALRDQVDAGTLLIGPRTRITDEEREQIRQHRDELLAVVNYVDTIQVM